VMAPIRNNVIRLLENRQIPYQAFELPAEKLGALEVAQRLQVPASQVFKTIVVKRASKGKPILAVIPGPSQVDLKTIAKTLGEKKIQLLTEKEAEKLTRLQAGGISPLALLNRGFETIIDQTAKNFEEIYISGGQRGLNIRLAVNALVQLTKAKIALISHPLD